MAKLLVAGIEPRATLGATYGTLGVDIAVKFCTRWTSVDVSRYVIVGMLTAVAAVD